MDKSLNILLEILNTSAVPNWIILVLFLSRYLLRKFALWSYHYCRSKNVPCDYAHDFDSKIRAMSQIGENSPWFVKVVVRIYI